jgi:alkanesulfonate monooxygenase SsuD/methylene tetrahydromethanopterin reductase-like flavin-dependent oxidoreductase (luciferase family)
MIERARTANRAGFASLSIGDHHNMGVPYAQNTPMLGRLLAEWPDRPAGCLFLVPLWHPVLMAEHIGTLAAIHQTELGFSGQGDPTRPTPFIVQTGIGYGQAQFRAMGADHSTRGRVLEATIEAVKAMLAGETVDDERLDLVGGRVGLLPDEPVEWWIGGGVDVAIERAARMGDAWYAGPGAGPDELAGQIDTYRSAGGERVIVRKDALVLADGDEARRRATEMVEAGYRGMGLDVLVVGDADDAATQLAPYAEVGVDEIVVRCMSVPQDLAIETLSLLGPLDGQV